jgi:sec-independent protein translocase protein TatB
MFDVGFSEIVVIGVVALVVLGPERLPKVARTAGLLFGRLQRYVANVKADIQREMDAAELGRLKDEMQDAARSIEHSVNQQMQSVEAQARALQETFEPGAGRESAAGAGSGDAPQPPVPAQGADPATHQQQLDLGIDEPNSPPSTQQKLLG